MQRPATTFAILAYEGIEPIDIGATYGVLSMAKRVAPDLRFFVVAKAGGELAMASGLRLIADSRLRRLSSRRRSDGSRRARLAGRVRDP